MPQREEWKRDSERRTGQREVYEQIAGEMLDYRDGRSQKPRIDRAVLRAFHPDMNEWLNEGAAHERYIDVRVMMLEELAKTGRERPCIVYVHAEALRTQIDRWVAWRRQQAAGGGDPQDAGRNAPPDQNAPPPPRP